MAKDSAATLGATINLSQYGTQRSGSDADAEALNLPRKRLNLHMTCPCFRSNETYIIALQKKRTAAP
jgi:hypothetical protein